MSASVKKGGRGDVSDAAAIEAEIERIRKLKLDEVKALWRETFKRDVPKALTRDLLVRTICWHIQEEAFGGHSPAILKMLTSYAKGQPMEADRLRRLKPGTELVREYQGERHTVVISGDGYRWRGECYPSLSAVARAITGSNWNGPRFFGLREGGKGPEATKTSGPPPGRYGPRPQTGEGASAPSVRPKAMDMPAERGGQTGGATPSAKVKSCRREKGGHHG